jgi:multidrug transporter EmrE-like cation transporter
MTSPVASHWALILIAAAANVALNLCLKQGGRGLDTSGLGALVRSLALSPWIWLACLSAAVLLTAFVAAIRVYSLSLTYTAVTALAMVALTVLGVALQQEQITLLRGLGLAFIVGGLVLTAAA